MFQRLIKFLFDRLLSFLGLIVLSPVMLVVAVLIMVKMGGPVLFKQQRVGTEGKLFTMAKFRTMKADHSGLPHGGSVIYSGVTSEGNSHVIEYSLSLKKLKT